MSDIHSEANLRGSRYAVAPLWRLPMDQKKFSSWSNSSEPGTADQQAGQFSSFTTSETPITGADLQQEDVDIFDVAYKKGWEDGQAAVDGERVENNQAADRLSKAMDRLDDLYSAGSFEFILAAIESLFRRCAELAVPDERLLQAWATKLADSIDEDQKGASLILHPDDLAIMDRDKCRIPLKTDANMLRGNLKLSHSGGWVEKGSEVVLDQLRSLIDEFSSKRGEGGS